MASDYESNNKNEEPKISLFSLVMKDEKEVEEQLKAKRYEVVSLF